MPTHLRMQAVSRESIDELVELVAYRLGPARRRVSDERLAELVRLVVRHWPHHHLEQIGTGVSRHHAAFTHATALMRASVRERYEAAHGLSPAWSILVRPVVEAIGLVVMELWWHGDAHRAALRAMQRQLGGSPQRRDHGVDDVADGA